MENTRAEMKGKGEGKWEAQRKEIEGESGTTVRGAEEKREARDEKWGEKGWENFGSQRAGRQGDTERREEERKKMKELESDRVTEKKRRQNHRT